MAYTYRHPFQRSTSDIQLKPMPAAENMSSRSGLGEEYYNPEYYNPLPPHEGPNTHLQGMQAEDRRLTRRINILQIVSRVIAAILSVTTLAPLTMTLIKYFQTRNTYYTVDGESRTAWAADTRSWYTYMYFSVAAISFLLNIAILIAYCRGIKRADSTARVAGWWSNFTTVAHVAGWIASVAIYRYGKEPVAGEFRDLWGWTCSKAADELQAVITDVDYGKFCNIQSFSWYSGLVNVGTALLSGTIFVMMTLQKRRRKRMTRAGYSGDEAKEPLRA